MTETRDPSDTPRETATTAPLAEEERGPLPPPPAPERSGPAVPPALQALAHQYRPTVNIEAAPPFAVPMPFVAAGLVALAIAGWRLWLLRRLIAGGLFAAPPVILTVHVVTLGFLTLTMTGLLYQWVPVVFDVPAVPSRWAWFEGAGYAVGLVLFLVGWGIGNASAVEGGGVLLATALSAFVGLTVARIVRSQRKPDTVTVGIPMALTGLTATWVLGLMMIFGWPAGPLALRLGLHISTALVAWVATLVATVQLKLVPMFTMARVTRRSLAPFVLVGLWAGLAATWFDLLWPIPRLVPVVLWIFAALTALYQITVLKRGGKAPALDAVLVPVVSGWGLWLGAAILSVIAPEAAVAVALLGGVTFILGYQSRIIPFIVALAIGRRLPGPPHKAFFMARVMGSSLGPILTSVAGILSALLLAMGLIRQNALAVGVAGLVLDAAVLLHLALVVSGLRAGRQAAARPIGPS